jgi:hypothetical protein
VQFAHNLSSYSPEANPKIAGGESRRRKPVPENDVVVSDENLLRKQTLSSRLLRRTMRFSIGS